jgi:hypothetical protein
VSRSRRPAEAHRPLYARLLRLRWVTPSGFLCFIFLEGAVALGVLLALAELVSWWGVVLLPVTVAVMVKLNDVVAGALMPRPAVLPPVTASVQAPMPIAEEATTRLPGVISRGRGEPVRRPWAEQIEAQQQRVRQSASRRYE